MTLRLTEHSFKESLHGKRKDGDEPIIETDLILVDFHAPWCGPCRAIALKIAKLINSKYFDRVTLAKVDIDSEPSIAEHYNISTVPTFMLFRKGSTRTKYAPVVGADMRGVELLIRDGLKPVKQ
jgi:thioredoxin 1